MEVKNGKPAIGQRVEVYYNLQKKGYYSIRVNGIVQAYVSSITLTNCTAKIENGKYDKIHRENKRTVCASIVGTIAAIETAKPAHLQTAITYNPFRRKDFHTFNGNTFTAAPTVHLESALGWIEGSAASEAAAAIETEEAAEATAAITAIKAESAALLATAARRAAAAAAEDEGEQLQLF